MSCPAVTAVRPCPIRLSPLLPCCCSWTEPGRARVQLPAWASLGFRRHERLVPGAGVMNDPFLAPDVMNESFMTSASPMAPHKPSPAEAAERARKLPRPWKAGFRQSPDVGNGGGLVGGGVAGVGRVRLRVRRSRAVRWVARERASAARSGRGWRRRSGWVGPNGMPTRVGVDLQCLA